MAGAGAATYFMYFAPEPAAKRVADNVMRAASLNQLEQVRSFGTSENAESFTNASSQRNFRHSGTAEENGTFYISYDFTDEQSPAKARIGVANGAVSLLSTGNQLGALPQDDGEEAVAAEEEIDLCLTREDLRFLDSRRPYAQNFRAATMIFREDESRLTEYAFHATEPAQPLIDRIGKFYERSYEKDYQVMIRGYAPDPEAYPSEHENQITLSQARATKILEDLVKAGVSRDRITIDNPRIYTQAPPARDDNWVDIDIVSRCE